MSTIEVVEEDALAEFQAQRAWLFGLAYRLLGGASEAEDILQEAYLRWRSAAAPDNPAAWLTRVVTNLCLTRLTSARARRERYVGTWLPEPVLTSGGADPLEIIAGRDTVSLGFLVLLEKLTPPERAAFVLRTAFDYSHREIAAILDTDEPNARQLYHRARARIGEPRRRFAASPEQRTKLVERFMAATVHGDLPGLERILTEDVITWADGGGRVTAARKPISGKDRVAHFFAGLASTRRAKAAALAPAEVNGEPGILVREHGELTGVLVPAPRHDLVFDVFVVVNPDKLSYIEVQLEPGKVA
ncbi:RNA polymerase sigma factor SigJ [Amycolatopsis sp. GM8]|uniref:RNA polymerase sigma factor SigJ n=1 Tax=Amycolatopsis sp. GM8 TaxID=2896530 RepID=UPI001F0324FB|nr:RNA polymerase sigma factor SigJ [Amycolatopsis sp. GM8]